MAVKIVSTSAIKPKPGGAYEEAVVYACCAKYYAIKPSYTSTCKCQACGRVLTAPVTVPKILLVKNA